MANVSAVQGAVCADKIHALKRIPTETSHLRSDKFLPLSLLPRVSLHARAAIPAVRAEAAPLPSCSPAGDSFPGRPVPSPTPKQSSATAAASSRPAALSRSNTMVQPHLDELLTGDLGEWDGTERLLVPVQRILADAGTDSSAFTSLQQMRSQSLINAVDVPVLKRKTKIVCTIGPTSNTREMIWKLAQEGMNVVRLNMSHGDHASHLKVIELVREYNKAQNAPGSTTNGQALAIMLDTKGPEVRSGDLPHPIFLEKDTKYTFTINRGVGSTEAVSVNYDGFIDDVDVGDTVLVDGGILSLLAEEKTATDVLCKVIDGGEFKSRRHLNVRGKSATLPSITEKDWEDIHFGVEHSVDYYALSFVKDAQVVLELREFLKGEGASIGIISKIESADSIQNLQAILEASDGAMVARGDLGAELPVEEVPILQDEIIRICRTMGKPVIVATNMLESMINHPAPTRAEVSDIAIAVREGTDAIMLSGETAHGKYPLKAVRVMHTVALETEATMPQLSFRPTTTAPTPLDFHTASSTAMSEMFAFHATMMANTLGASILVFTRSGFMATLLSHYRPSGATFAFTNDKRVQQRLALYHGVRALFLPFSSDAEKTFAEAIQALQTRGLVKAGEDVALVQSGRQPIWRSESTHHIQVRRVQPMQN